MKGLLAFLFPSLEETSLLISCMSFWRYFMLSYFHFGVKFVQISCIFLTQDYLLSLLSSRSTYFFKKKKFFFNGRIPCWWLKINQLQKA